MAPQMHAIIKAVRRRGVMGVAVAWKGQGWVGHMPSLTQNRQLDTAGLESLNNEPLRSGH